MSRACAVLIGFALLAASGCDWKNPFSSSPAASSAAPPAAPPPAAEAAAVASARFGAMTDSGAMRDAVGPASVNQLPGGRLFDGRSSDPTFGGSAVLASFSPTKTVAGFTGYTAPADPLGLHVSDRVPAPAAGAPGVDTDQTNPLGARIDRFIGAARAVKNFCYEAVAKCLIAAGAMDPPPAAYSGSAYMFAVAYDHDVAKVKERFVEARVPEGYPFRRGAVLVWGTRNCSVSGTAVGRANGHIEIVKRLNCKDPTHPDRPSCPSITDRHFDTVTRDYEDISRFAGRTNEVTGDPCLRAFLPRAAATANGSTSI